MRKIRKIPGYLIKLIHKGKLQELLAIAIHFKTKSFLTAVAARLDRRVAHLELRNGSGIKDVNLVLDVLPFKSRQVDDHFYEWNVKERTFLATLDQFEGMFSEYLSEAFKTHYGLDWEGKKVLDIGGFVGDSALFFLENNARHIDIYEPSELNLKSLRFNLKPYSSKVNIFKKAIASRSGPTILLSDVPEGVLGFGMNTGSHRIQCEGITFSEILKSSDFDVAKVDCEGGEEYLTTTDNALIQKVPYWIVETHSQKIYSDILLKFSACGFETLRDIAITSSVNLLHFSNKR